MGAGSQYVKIVEWSEEDQCFVGSCPGLFYAGCHGNDEREVFAELCELVDEKISLYIKDRIPLPEPTCGRDYPNKPAELKTDVGYLKGSDLESDLEVVHGRIVPLVGQHLRLRRVWIIARALRQAAGDFDESLARAERDGRIGAEQRLWILITGLILRGERQRDGRPLWIAVEVANRIGVKNIVRSRMSADALAEAFAEDAVGAVAGYRIDAADRERAATAGVRCLDVPERF